MGSASTSKPQKQSRRARARKARKEKEVRDRPLSRREKQELAEKRKKAMQKWLPPVTASLIINGALLIWLASFVLSQPVPPAPNFSVAAPHEDGPEEVKNQTLERKRKQHQSRPSSADFTPVIVPNVSHVAFDTPQFDSSEMADLSGVMIGLDTGLGLGASGAGTGEATESGTIGGMNVRSRRLGVILDVSASMSEQIKAVRKELRKSFSRAVIVEVAGCRLDYDTDDEDAKEIFDPSKSKIEMKQKAGTVTEAVEMLVVRHRADAVYWFSDLNDARTKAGLDRLSQLLGTHFGSERRPVKFYVQSVDEAPDEKLEGIATRSGGATKVKAYDVDTK